MQRRAAKAISPILEDAPALGGVVNRVPIRLKVVSVNSMMLCLAGYCLEAAGDHTK
jgi:hypothetical protein